MRTSQLKQLGACNEAKDFCRKQSSYQQAWETTNRVDWMLWALCNTGTENARIAVGLSVDFAERATQHAGPLRGVCNIANEAARAWVNDPTPENATAARAARAARAAGDAAWAAAWAAAGDAAGDAARAAGDAARAAGDAARAAGDAENQWQCDRIRQVVPACPIPAEPNRNKEPK